MANKEFDNVQLFAEYDSTVGSNVVNVFGNKSKENIAYSLSKIKNWFPWLVPANGSAGQILEWYNNVPTWRENTNASMVKQTHSTDTDYHPLVLGAPHSASAWSGPISETTDQVYMNKGVYVKPSTSTIYATNYIGNINGFSLTGTSGSTYDLNSFITSQFISSITTTGNGNGVTAIGVNNGVMTVTKGSTFSLEGHSHTLSIATDTGNSQLSMSANTKYKLTAGGSTFIFTTPPDGVRSTTINGNYLRVNTNGSDADLTIPYATTASKLGTVSKGSTTKGIYLDAGDPKEMTYSLNSTVNSGTANCIAYYSGANAISSAAKVTYVNANNSASTPATVAGLHIESPTYGNTAANMLGGVAGVFSYGDGGPQIRFKDGSSTQAGALIFTADDAAASGTSWHFVSNETDWNVISKRFHAKTSISIGTDKPSTSYNLTVNGTSYFNNTITIKGTSSGNASIYYASYGNARNTASIRFYDGDVNGQGIQIGGGGLTVVGGGESAQTVFDNLSTLGLTTSSEAAVIASDGPIYFYTNVDTGIANRKAVSINTSGYLNTYYINMATSDEDNSFSSSSAIIYSNSDKYLRRTTFSKLASLLQTETTIYDGHVIHQTDYNSAGFTRPVHRFIRDLRPNKLAFTLPANITMEYSTNAGSSWTSFGYTDAQKAGPFISRHTGGSIAIGPTSGERTTSMQTRITITNDGRDCFIDQFYIWMSTSGHGTTVDIQYTTQSAKTTWVDWRTNVSVAGWAGPNIINVSELRYGNTIYSIRFTFKITSIHADYKTQPGTIYDIQAYGGMGCWGSKNNMMTHDSLYTWDYEQNTTFPANVSATKFIGPLQGNADSATLLNHKSLNSTTLDNTAGSFAFSGSGDPWAGTDWVGLQIGDSVDKWQISGTGTSLVWRQNDNGGTTSTGWSVWKSILDSENYTSYTVTKTGTGASGTWGISITGNAATATTASKLGTSTVGSGSRPIYLNAGTPTQCDTPTSGAYWNGVPGVASNGVMEIGKYIDFHASNTTTLDYDYRITAESQVLHFSPKSSGDATYNLLQLESPEYNQIRFSTSKTGKAYTSTGIVAYPLTTSGQTMLIQSDGNTVVGGGESPRTLYSNSYDNMDTAENETLYLASDSSEIHFITNCQAYSGRKVLKVQDAQLVKSGGLWISARDNAPVYANKANTQDGGYYPAWFAKTKSGGWSMGVLSAQDNLYITYTTDTDYSGGNNNNTYTIQFQNKSGTVALTSDIPAADDHKVTQNNLTSGGIFPVILGGNVSAATVTDYVNKKYDALRLGVAIGTTSTDGYGELLVGNATASGTAGNTYGQISIYSSNTAGAALRASSTTSWRFFYFPGDKGGTVAVTTDLAAYLPLAGGTMSGTITHPANTVAINLRNDSTSTWQNTIMTQSAGDEAVVFANANARTSWMFVNGEDSIAHPENNRWQSLTPALQIKDGCVAIGKLIPSGTTPTTRLDIAGSTALTGDVMLKTTGSSSDDSGDIIWYYGNGKEKMRIWTDNTYTAAKGPNYRVYKSDGTLLYNGNLPLANGTGASGTWDINITGNASGYSNTVYGIYTGSGGVQAPNYFGKNRVGFLMSNVSITGDTHYKNIMYMDCYSGTDVGGVTALAIDRTEARAWILQSDANRTAWNNTAAIGVFTATPTSGQVVITDGTTGGIKSSGYTIAKSVPSNADFTNTWRGIQDNLTSSSNTTESLSAKQGYLLANGSARDSTKVLKAGDTMSGNLTFGSSVGIIQTQNSGSNYTTTIKWWTGGTDPGTYGPEIGQWNTGGDSTYPGRIIIMPYHKSYSSGSGQWGNTAGLCIEYNHVYIDGTELSKVGHTHDYAPSSGSMNYIQAIRNTSKTTASGGYWAAMCNSTSAGSPTLPTAGKWWHVLSMDWNNDVTNWISQLALPTQDGESIYYRKNPSSGSSIENGVWRKVVDEKNLESIQTSPDFTTQVYISNQMGPATRAVNHYNRANKLAFIPASNITIEYSTDGGSNWTNMETNVSGTNTAITATDKANVFTGLNLSNIPIGPNGSTNRTTSMQTRITITNDTRDCILDQLMFGIGPGYHQFSIEVQVSLGSATNTFYTLHSAVTFATWTYQGIINLPKQLDIGGTKYDIRFGTSNSMINKIRFIIRQTAVNSNKLTDRSTISNIMGYSGIYWGANAGSTLAKIDHLYRWDASQNAYFPAEVRVPTQLRVYNDNYGAIFRVDANNIYLLPTNANDPQGSWSSLVPFYINNSTGKVTMAKDAYVAGNLYARLSQKTNKDRQSTANLSCGGTGSMQLILATSTMDPTTSNPNTGKPASDGFILDFDWDNTGQYKAQIFVSNSGASVMQWRGQTGSSDWSAANSKWHTLVDSINFKPYKSITQRLFYCAGAGWRRIMTIRSGNNNGYVMNDIKIFVRRHYNNASPESFSFHVINNYDSIKIRLLHAEQYVQLFDGIRVSKSSDSKYQYIEINYTSPNNNAVSVRYDIISPYTTDDTVEPNNPTYPADNTTLAVVSDSPTPLANLLIPTGISQFNLRQVNGSYSGYFGMADATGSDSAWIRTTSQGIIPYDAGVYSTGGSCYLGTSGWYFKEAYISKVFANTIDCEGLAPRHTNEINFKSPGSTLWFGYRIITDDKGSGTTSPTTAIGTYLFGCGKANTEFASLKCKTVMLAPGTNAASYAQLTGGTLTATRTINAPDSSGTMSVSSVALTSAGTDSGYVDVPTGSRYLIVEVKIAATSVKSFHKVAIDTSITSTSLIQTTTKGQYGLQLTIQPIQFVLSGATAITGGTRYLLTMNAGSVMSISAGTTPSAASATPQIVKVYAQA